ncbi:hypothetical protein ACFL47_06975 [Candidatus Latescibacterota bacterium]
MNVNPEIFATRRDFIKRGLRAIMITGIACVCGLLGLRNIRSARDESLCVIELPCKKCTAYKHCADPRAVESKRKSHTKVSGYDG